MGDVLLPSLGDTVKMMKQDNGKESDWAAGATLYAQSRPPRKVTLNLNSEWEEGASFGKIQGGRFIQARRDIRIFFEKNVYLFYFGSTRSWLPHSGSSLRHAESF